VLFHPLDLLGLLAPALRVLELRGLFATDILAATRDEDPFGVLAADPAFRCRRGAAISPIAFTDGIVEP